MKKIKFKIWDKHQKKFIPPEDIIIDGNGKISISNLNSDVRQVEDLEIIFFADLKDKNDKEIYDKHLAEYHNDLLNINFIVRIFEEDGCFWYRHVRKNVDKDFGRIPLYRMNKYMKIIGNICENPEKIGDITWNVMSLK